MFTTSISLISFGIANKTKDNSEAEKIRIGFLGFSYSLHYRY